MSGKKIGKAEKGEGFSIIEVVVAIGIVSATFMAMMILFANNLRMEIYNRNRIVAAYLAQEGIEIVKQKRDSNWFSGLNWRDGLQEGSNLFFSMKDQNDPAKGWIISSSDGAKKIYLSNGAYVQSKNNKPSSWVETGFTRTVKIEYLDDNSLRLTINVGYNEGTSSVKMTSYLYNGWFN